MSDEEREEEEIVCLEESFFVNNDYKLTSFTFGSHVLELLCLHSASTDFDLTGQLVWPGALLMNDYLYKNADAFQNSTIIELGSGVGISGILCSRFCSRVLLTDHNDEVLKILNMNIDLQVSSGNLRHCELAAEKLEWGNAEHVEKILQKHPRGFDIMLGADICFQQSSISLLFDTVKLLLSLQGESCIFKLAYISRAKTMDTLVLKEARQRGLSIQEVNGTRSVVGNHEGVIFDVLLH